MLDKNSQKDTSRKRIGKAVARGSKKAVAQECFKDQVTSSVTWATP
jgi:hypothetical protein